MTKNPFSLYDFLGYLFPGMAALMLTVFLVHLNKTYEQSIPIDCYFKIKEFVAAIEGNKGLKWWENTVLIVIIAYIAGHITAYLSSRTIEYFTNAVMGYPSYYLLHEDKRHCVISEFFQGSKRWDFWKWLYRVVILVFLFPIAIFMIPKALRKFISRPLDDYVINSIQMKLRELSATLNLNVPDVNSKADYHRIVMHYVYLNIPQSQRKADNYVAIYGFLRAITLIACLFFDYLLVAQVLSINPYLSINWQALGMLLMVFLLTNILYMGFVKFYRRFTLENYMALLTEKKEGDRN